MIEAMPAGGFGIQIFEESGMKPKLIIENGDKPLLCYIIKS